MRRSLVTGFGHLVLMAVLGSASAQVAAGGSATASSISPGPGQNVPAAAPLSSAGASVKQLALQAQIDRLVAMATELREQVDKTNKNILSVKVVRKAEEIEAFAKRMKEQNRK